MTASEWSDQYRTFPANDFIDALRGLRAAFGSVGDSYTQLQRFCWNRCHYAKTKGIRGRLEQRERRDGYHAILLGSVYKVVWHLPGVRQIEGEEQSTREEALAAACRVLP